MICQTRALWVYSQLLWSLLLHRLHTSANVNVFFAVTMTMCIQIIRCYSFSHLCPGCGAHSGPHYPQSLANLRSLNIPEILIWCEGNQRKLFPFNPWWMTVINFCDSDFVDFYKLWSFKCCLLFQLLLIWYTLALNFET